MIPEFQKYDKYSQRILYIKTETFNALLASINAPIRVVPRDVEQHNRYEIYRQDCESSGKTPLCELDYNKYSPCPCGFEIYENATAESLISKALGVKAVKVKYAKDWYGRMTDDELEVTYHA